MTAVAVDPDEALDAFLSEGVLEGEERPIDSEAAAVKAYLSGLETDRPKRGRKRTVETAQRQLDEVTAALDTATGLDRLNLLQDRANLTAELAARAETVDHSAVEDAFVVHAASYSERHGISKVVWREAGVPAEVLKRAGIR